MTPEELTALYGEPTPGISSREWYWETGRMTRGSSLRFWKRWVWRRYPDGTIARRYYRVYEGEPHWRPMP